MIYYIDNKLLHDQVQKQVIETKQEIEKRKKQGEWDWSESNFNIR